MGTTKLKLFYNINLAFSYSNNTKSLLVLLSYLINRQLNRIPTVETLGGLGRSRDFYDLPKTDINIIDIIEYWITYSNVYSMGSN